MHSLTLLFVACSATLLSSSAAGSHLQEERTSTDLTNGRVADGPSVNDVVSLHNERAVKRDDVSSESTQYTETLAFRHAIKTREFWLQRAFELVVTVATVYSVIWAYGKMGCPFQRWPLKLLVKNRRVSTDVGGGEELE